MEDYTDDVNMLKERLLVSQNRRGGLKTLPFIIANGAFANMAYCGLTPDMILYLTIDYGLPLSMGTKIVYMWSTATFIIPFFGAILSDCYFGRFPMIGFGCISCLLGMILLWLTAMISELRPPLCDISTQSCKSATFSQLLVVCSSFFLMSVGYGAVHSSSLAFGADQLYCTDNSESASFPVEKYFSWYYQLILTSVFVAFGGLVYAQEHFGWKVGFGIPVALMFLSALSFFVASPLYVKLTARKGMFSGLAQVIKISFRSRHLKLPSDDMDGSYNVKEGSHLTIPSNKLRFLNKACIVTNPEQILTSDKIVSDPSSRLCTVDQVEELKALIKAAPILSTSVTLFAASSQTSIQVVLVKTMDRHITQGFEIPAGSFSLFTVFFCIFWLALYNHIILSLASKVAGRPVNLSIKTRMGIGHLCYAMAMASAAIVECVRRKTAIQEGFADKPLAVINMSVWWLLPKFFLCGVADALSIIGMTEFFYKEFPKSMSSIASVLTGVGGAMGVLLTTFVFSTVDDVTGKRGKESWVSSNINKAHFDYYFWLLSILCLVNFAYYIICCKAYGPCVDEAVEDRDDEDAQSTT